MCRRLLTINQKYSDYQAHLHCTSTVFVAAPHTLTRQFILIWKTVTDIRIT